MKNESVIILKNKFTEIKKLSDDINSFTQKNNLHNELQLDILLVIEELVANIISYAFDDNAEHKIIIRLAVNNKTLTVEIADEGRAFNPLDYPTPDISKPLEQREVGGLGIFFVKELMDSVEYERKENKNILTMTKQLIVNS